MKSVIEQSLLEKIKSIHFSIVKNVTSNLSSDFSPIISNTHNHKEVGDVSYDIDVKAEKIIISKLKELEGQFAVTLTMEGMGTKKITESETAVHIIFDPIDGTREIMYDKRSAWILTGISLADNPTLDSIEIAVQTEIPVSKQTNFSYLYAIKGKGAFEEIYHKDTFELVEMKRRIHSPSIQDLEDGYICFPNPFPGIKLAIAERYERFFNLAFPPPNTRDAFIFSDEYLSTGGQIYLLATGQYRIVADIREYVQHEQISLCCHPYDLCTALIATEAEVVITDLNKTPLAYPFDTTTNCNWVGFTSRELYDKYQEILFHAILFG